MQRDIPPLIRLALEAELEAALSARRIVRADRARAAVQGQHTYWRRAARTCRETFGGVQ